MGFHLGQRFEPEGGRASPIWGRPSFAVDGLLREYERADPASESPSVVHKGELLGGRKPSHAMGWNLRGSAPGFWVDFWE